MEHGDLITFEINLKENEMKVVKLGHVLKQIYKPSENESKAIPITPLVHALECLTKVSPQAEPPYYYLMDVWYDNTELDIRLHCAEDYDSVVEVPRERLKKVLGHLLTPRELEIATLLFEGCTIRYIAAVLHIAEGTVKRIIYNIYRKLGVPSQVELVREIYVRLAEFYAPPTCEECTSPEKRPSCCIRRDTHHNHK